MNIFDIQGLLDNTATVTTKIEILPKAVGESISTLTNEDSIKKWVYSDLRYVAKQGFIGQFVARTLDGELQDISDDFDIEDSDIFDNSEFTLSHDTYISFNSDNTLEMYESLNGDSVMSIDGDKILVGETEFDYEYDGSKISVLGTVLFERIGEPDPENVYGKYRPSS